MSQGPLSYLEAGVDIPAADAFAARIRRLAQQTHGPEVLPSGDAYAGLFRPPLADHKAPLIAATCDGVGTKILTARDCGRYRELGQDLVAMNVNDLLPRGARPLFFLDYIAMGHIHSVPLSELAEGIVEACARAGCALLGGETAEMPDVYAPGDFDLAGFAVGWVEQDCVPRGDVAAGDVVLGLPSSGVHANGFSLLRRVLRQAGLAYTDVPSELSRPLGVELLQPTALYVDSVLALMRKERVKAAAHITGGGLLGRASKLAGNGLRVVIEPDRYRRPPIFDFIARVGPVSPGELARTFNMGLGFLVVVEEAVAERVLAEPACAFVRVGYITTGSPGADLGYARTAA